MTRNADTYEKLGAFYLGRAIDPETGDVSDEPLLYDSRDLTTHAMCVGMTGSGKTGLCIGLLEEAAIDGIPSLVIDPKGDLTNLLLTFPDLLPDDFAPWINPDDARRKNETPEEYARSQAELWKGGLEKWDQDGERIRRLRAAADFTIFTPGSDAGTPVSILASFAAPPPELIADTDMLRDRITSTVTSLLGLLGIDSDPLRSRDHILLSTIMEHAWREGTSLDLGALIQLIQKPPVTRLGVLDLESFYPSKERFELALALNNLLAAPGFATWMTGEPLDVDRMLYTPDGRPRVSIFYIAHLSEAERMFFVSLLLNQTVGWMRSRSGTTSLRALLYMDEIFGYMPPVSEPPSKKPLLTLLKQARAFGVGVVLATQNPVDLDYKGLSNCGTWFLGRLQTERDKNRVLDGLEGVAAGASGGFDRARLEQVLAGLGKRVFLMHNVHEPAPTTFHTRWVMSYLRGPLTRPQIRTLTAAQRPAEPILSVAPVTTVAPAATTSVTTPAATVVTSATAHASSVVEAAPAPSGAPVLPPEIVQTWLPVRHRGGAGLVYRPRLLGLGHVQFVDTRKGLEASEPLAMLAPFEDGPRPVDWGDAARISLDEDDLDRAPAENAPHAEVPALAAKFKSYTIWEKALDDWVYRNLRYPLLRSSGLKEYSHPGENERDFRIRLADRAREERDERLDALRKKYASRFERLRERVRKAKLAVQREQEQASGAKMQTAISIGATLLSAVLGRKVSSTTIGKATTAARGAGYAAKQAQDVSRALEDVDALEEQIADLEREFEADADDIRADLDPTSLELETVSLKPRKTDIDVRLLALAWTPYTRDVDGTLVPAWRPPQEA